MTQVVPAIIPKTKEQFTNEIDLVSSFSNLIQIDISDGVFTRFKTWPYNDYDHDSFERMRAEEEGWPKWETIDYEIHLMVMKPEDIVLDWIRTGISSVVAHIEATDDFQKVIDICREHNVSIWVAIKPGTDISRIEPFVSQVAGIQCMGSDLLGKHGVELEDKAVEQIKKLHQMYPDSIIGIDIGVTLETKEILLEAGATKFISGSEILDAENPREVYEELLS